MPRIRVKENFYDRENDLKLVEKGAEMEVSEERAEKLIGLDLVEMVEEEKIEEEPKPKKSKGKKGEDK